MKEITYSLCKGNYNSNLFYKKLSSFTLDIEKNISYTCEKYVKDFINFLEKNNIENIRTNSEYYLEILMMGVLWKNYINRAVNLQIIPKHILIILSYLRKYEIIKNSVDKKRGMMETYFLNIEDNKQIELNINNFGKLMGYLDAIGDFKEEVKRLEPWEKYFICIGEDEAKKIILSSLEIEEIFENKAKIELGIYTENVSEFLILAEEKYKYREDYITCRRKEVEYHLNMVGAEIMNKSYRELFIKSKEKRLLLPSCMRAKNENYCKAVKTEEGYICTHCTKSCNVNRYDKLGKGYNFQVYIIPHESDITIKTKFQYGDIGIIGVACVLNLISGGFKAKSLGFVPQCVFLDYCGCKYHWHENGIMTDINEDKLLNTLGINDNISI
ncbi:DUF116 domain-containing protein [Terrisporobacter mayombei]|uniref:DUF116 domain-containing protein n=1 Tax=Terrisporobacter mayombei TaxID=1541 RepID=A0ABY9Q413_9FIRM|nr:DUF116 domain-containing protein [Terrisporobacter mayombei]MCC3867067.1 DUF116 domain-containing protein [Terrisporobacter mayombei]WMT81327.1 hypothetical protein TEMA_16670 [Terrisporobacter mayombei]